MFLYTARITQEPLDKKEHIVFDSLGSFFVVVVSVYGWAYGPRY